MKQVRSKLGQRWQWGLMLTVAGAIAVPTATPTLAQVRPDASLPQPSTVEPSGNTLEIFGGTRAGDNLFHSFQQFDLATGELAHFQNALDVRHIIARVTGGSASNIDGILRANGSANLYLLNANGLIFGENARLDLGGNFLGTTGDLRLADGSVFSAVPEGGTPLLSVAVPVGLQTNARRGDITLRGTGHNLFFDADLSTARDDRPDGFAVSPGARLSLVGRSLQATGANLTAESGEIALSALVSGRWDLDAPGEVLPENQYGEVRFAEATSVDVSGNGGGQIWLTAENLFLASGSTLLADTLGDAPGRGITVRVRDTVDVRGLSPEDGLFSSGFFAAVAPGASGAGGNVSIASDRLFVVDGAIVGADTFGSGNAGTFAVRSREIETRNSFWSGSSFSTATGRGGRIVLEGDRLLAADGAQILAFSTGAGDAGAIEVRMAESVEIRGTGEAVSTVFNSVLSASVESEGTGRGGRVMVDTARLRVANGGAISAGTSGNSPTSRAGVLEIRASEWVEVVGTDANGVPSVIASNTFASAPGADVRVTTPRLVVRDGGQVASGTFGSGDGGRVVLTVSEEISLAGSVPAVPVRNRDFFRDDSGTRFPSGIFSASEGAGAAGNLSLTAGRLSVRDGAEVTVGSIAGGGAGTLSVTVDRLSLNRGRLRADSSAGLGSIAVRAADVRLTNGSRISTNARGTEPGGNIAIETETLLALDNSDITAIAANSRGGRIQIEALGVFGAQPRSQLTPESDITASSALGSEFSGVVEVREPEVETESVVSLETEVVDVATLVSDRCSAVRSGSQFVVTGRGGLPLDDPRWLGLGTFGLVEPRSLGAESRPEPRAETDVQRPDVTSPPLREAQQWRRNAEGNVELLARSPSAPRPQLWGDAPCVSIPPDPPSSR